MQRIRVHLEVLEPSGVELSRRQLDVGRHRLGRGADCEVRAPLNGLSREHVLLEVLPSGGVLIEDLGSTNGTRIDGLAVQRAAVRHGATLQAGPLLLRITEADTELDGLAYRTGEQAAPTTAAPVIDEGTQLLTLRERLRDALWASPADFPAALNRRIAAIREVLDVDALQVVHLDGSAAGVVIAAAGDPEQATEALADDGRHAIRASTGSRQRHAGLAELAANWLAWFPEASNSSPDPHAAKTPSTPPALPGVATADPGLRRQMDALARLARSRVAILLLGETGVGKDVMARWIHACSPRASGPFVAINCAALPRDLLEAELFGVEKGAATGVAERPGVFERADGGTLFLDELGDMPAETQVRLLRALEDGRIHRVGGRALIDVDVRLVSATHRDLQQAVAAGEFRLDLFHRIAGFEARIPPLRERRIDISPLAIHFFHEALAESGIRSPGITEAALRDLQAADWPGNVRELRQAIHSATALLADGDALDRQHLPPRLRGVGSGIPVVVDQREDEAPVTLAEAAAQAEHRAILRAIEAAEGDAEQAWTRLGIGKTTYYKKLKEHDIGRADDEVTAP